MFTSAHDSATLSTLSSTEATAVAFCWLLDCTRATTTTARLATAAASSHISVDLVVPSCSARRFVPSESCGELIHHTQLRTTATVTVQLTSGSSRGVATKPTIAPVTSPADRLISASRADSSRPEADSDVRLGIVMADRPSRSRARVDTSPADGGEPWLAGNHHA